MVFSVQKIIEFPVAPQQAPCIWQSLYCVRCYLWSKGLWIFRDMTPGMVSVFHTPRFDSGYTFGVGLRGLLEEFHMWTLVFQRNAWFNSGYKFMRQTTVFVVPVVVHDMCRMVQTMQNCLEVSQVQFLRGCGRRFVHAATSSRQSRDGVQIRSSTSSRRTELGCLPHF